VTAQKLKILAVNIVLALITIITDALMTKNILCKVLSFSIIKATLQRIIEIISCVELFTL